MELYIHPEIEEIPAVAWNRLVRDNNPFLRHEFLHAMEQHGCVSEVFGWLPCHIALYQDDELVAAMPLYQKQNSYGEFVFDHAWADAYQRSGLRYFPKLVSAIPYTPATGQRMLCLPGQEDAVYPLLLDSVLKVAEQLDSSGFHCLFPDNDCMDCMQQQGLLVRHDCQYHWHNQGYRDFEHFLSRLTAKKRKNIRQERRKVINSGVTIRVLDGHSATDRDWQDFTRFYNQTFEEKWGLATFNHAFFSQVARDLPEQVVLVLADLEGECVAGALMYSSDTTLYGRHWGSVRQVDSLHFEACYYQGIEYCIDQGLQRFEPGAQGEYKVARGFIPTLTRSAHWIRDEQYRAPIAAFVQHEQSAVAQHMAELESAQPYKKEIEE